MTHNSAPARAQVRGRTVSLVAVAAGAALLSSPALAEGRWIRGGSLDGMTPVSFGRYLAEGEEAQMTVRCDAVNGLVVDAGTTATGAPPADTDMDNQASATFAFVGAGGTTTLTVMGDVRIRNGSTVLVSISGAAAAELGTLLRAPADRVDVTIDGVTRPVYLTSAPPIGDAAALFNQLATTCSGWPQQASDPRTPMRSA